MIVLPASASAATFFAEESVTLLEVVPDDLYAVGDLLDIQHTVDGDAMLAGSSINVTGPVDGDVFALGESITLSGTVADDTLVAGQTVSITSPTTQDLFAAAATITVSSETTVTGDAFLAGEQVILSGTFEGDVMVAGGDIIVTDGSTIAGNLVSYAPQQPTIGNDVTIGGELKHREWTQSNAPSAKSEVLAWVRSVVTLFLAAAVLLYVMPASSQRIVDTTVTKPAPSFGAGVLWSILVIPVAVILMITFIGLPLAILLISLAVVLFIVGWAYSALVIGERVFSWITKKQVDALSWQHALLGAVALSAIGLIPIIGWLIVTILIVATLGATILVRWIEFRSVNA